MIRVSQYILIVGLQCIICGCPYKPAHRFDAVYLNDKFSINPGFVEFEKSASQLHVSIEIKNNTHEHLPIDLSETSIICKGDTFIVQNVLGVNNKKLSYLHQIAPSQTLVFGFRFVDILNFTHNNFELLIAGRDSVYAKFNFMPR
jgi:hypothetical protein